MRGELFFVAELDDGEPNILRDGPFLSYERARDALYLQASPRHCVIVSGNLDLEQW